ncbi:YbaB/EbfC family nucleoid-associated protein [Sciscionella sediminilitoris]|uniref:YbaB/EbfC family nucleoid-associated protein n=1 Tax=Sciscionella sediminilitoris TaxID=1445613 RepID=UPI00068F91C6|nr:YbaB/EbfC family nucleoid-associated protein [Sciscionella sp. SE31]
MNFAEFSRAAQHQREQRVYEHSERVKESVAGSGPLTGSASSADGTVTVEVAAGGLLRGVRISPQALTRGAPALRASILTAAKKATARANHRAQQAFAKAMGEPGADTARRLGLGYDPALLEDEEPPRSWR